MHLFQTDKGKFLSYIDFCHHLALNTVSDQLHEPIDKQLLWIFIVAFLKKCVLILIFFSNFQNRFYVESRLNTSLLAQFHQLFVRNLADGHVQDVLREFDILFFYQILYMAYVHDTWVEGGSFTSCTLKSATSVGCAAGTKNFVHL